MPQHLGTTRVVGGLIRTLCDVLIHGLKVSKFFFYVFQTDTTE